MKNWFYIVIIFSLFSCETDFPINAEYQEVPVVYGLLDQSETIQYVRVNKGFLHEGDIQEAVAEQDNLYYNLDSIEVWIYKTKETSLNPNDLTTLPIIIHLDMVYELRDSIKLDPVVIERDSILSDPNLIFANGNNIVYTFNTNSFNIQEGNLDSEKTYILSVRKKDSTSYNVVATAKTELVADAKFMSPLNEDLPQGRDIAFFNNGEYVPKSFKWEYSKNAVRYQFKIFFGYQEIINAITIDKTISKIYNIPSSDIENLTPPADIAFSLQANEFFYFLSSNILYNNEDDENDVTARIFGNIDWEIAAAEKELDIFLDLNDISTGINQNKPSYTNIIGGVGVFGSRYNRLYSNYSTNYPLGIPLSPQTKSQIKIEHPELKFN